MRRSRSRSRAAGQGIVDLERDDIRLRHLDGADFGRVQGVGGSTNERLRERKLRADV
jgi:hypothetical protein